MDREWVSKWMSSLWPQASLNPTCPRPGTPYGDWLNDKSSHLGMLGAPRCLGLMLPTPEQHGFASLNCMRGPAGTAHLITPSPETQCFSLSLLSHFPGTSSSSEKAGSREGKNGKEMMLFKQGGREGSGCESSTSASYLRAWEGEKQLPVIEGNGSARGDGGKLGPCPESDLHYKCLSNPPSGKPGSCW